MHQHPANVGSNTRYCTTKLEMPGSM